MSTITALFAGHGSPMNAIERNNFTAGWATLGKKISTQTPSAIIAVSAHWYTHETAVTAMDSPRTIHDFWGFPPALGEVNYPAPGSPEVAELVRDIAKPTPVSRDYEWGIDHGTWSVLTHMFPSANVPVVQLSINATQSFEYHLELGRKLVALASSHNALLVGSGNVVHNLGATDWHAGNTGFDWAQRFDDAAIATMLDDPSRLEALRDHPDFAKAVPTPDHFLPLAYIAGAALENNAQPEVFNDACTMGSLSMTGFTVAH